MAEPTKQTSPTFTFSKELLQKKLDRVIEFQNKFQGKHNHNPFLWIQKKVTPLYKRLCGFVAENGTKVAPETTKELHDAIMAIPEDEVPIINKNLKEEPAQPAKK
jgi:hypothetical protein